MPERIALLSVSDKTGLVGFAQSLLDEKFKLVSTGGTAAHLRDAGLDVMDVSELTGFPEVLDGRVKTLHPAVHAGLLARRDLPEHMEVLGQQGFPPIDIVAVNLYPFVQTAADPKKSFEDVVEQIDIGGPSMLRSAAKNHASVTVIVDPGDYATVLSELTAGGSISEKTRLGLARKVFTHTAMYDTAIANYLAANEAPAPAEGEAAWPAVHAAALPLDQTMRYGENPHQAAAFYRDPECTETNLASARQLNGKPLSYNNMLDADGALEMVRDFAGLAPAAAVIVKHSNPCGIGLGDTPAQAYEAARSTDPDSAFGGIVAFSTGVTPSAAEHVAATFNEIVLAPSFEGKALEILSRKKNLRVLELGEFTPKHNGRIARGIVGGTLVTERDLGLIGRDELRVVTEAKPGGQDLDGLLFAWRCVKWVKSNAIVYTSRSETIGIGAGQMSRVDSARIGASKARSSLKGSYMASDAFFPFRDCVDIAAEHGIRAIVQPGGSIRDDESIAAANEHGIIMVFTGMRHFRH